MTEAEFKTEFLTQFDDRVGPASAPGYGNYQISLLLTRAQEQLVKNYLDSDTNRLGDGYENTERRRRKLNFLVQRHVFVSATDAVPIAPGGPDPIIPGDLSYDINGLNILRIVQEHLILADDVKCRDSKMLKVIPIPHDEIDDSIHNPYRKPSKYQAWRIDSGSDFVNQEYVEISSSLPYTEYRFRYVKRPTPIIVGALPAAAPTIDGASTIQTSILPDTFHSEIVSRAVTNALARLGDPNVQGAMLVETRDE